MAVLDQVVDHIGALANSPRRDRGSTRAIYSYPAKFQAHLPAELIRLFMEPGALVVDPFSGGGTTGLEAFLAGRRFYGVDINPLGPLLGRVKTTAVAVADLPAGIHERGVPRSILDDDDRMLFGPAIADEIDRLVGGIDSVADAEARPDVADLLRVALLHTLKVAGRRDFHAPSLLPRFRRHVERIAAATESLPTSGPRPEFRLAPAHQLAGVADGAADLVVTSPPYKDLDVEYGLLQIQRPAENRSKRSRVVFELLRTPALPKLTLCGGRGNVYDRRLRPALGEIRRVLRPGAPAFFWIGFKTTGDRDRFMAALEAADLRPRHLVPVGLSRDRVASSRSTHHGRDTGMLARDYLVACE